MSLIATEVMTRDVVTVQPDDPIARIAKLLSDHESSAMPVCGEAGHVLGMVSEGDLMRPFSNEHVVKRAGWLNVLAERTELATALLDYHRINDRKPCDLIATPAITTPLDASVSEPANPLARHRIKAVPITHRSKLVGIGSRANVVRAQAENPNALAEPP